MKKLGAILLLASVFIFTSGNFADSAPTRANNKVQVAHKAKVSWYKHGKTTANGERFKPHNLTVAHKTLPFGTIVQFTNPENNKKIIARVNDRGPYVKGREFDLSYGAAKYLGIISDGVVILYVKILRT